MGLLGSTRNPGWQEDPSDVRYSDPEVPGGGGGIEHRNPGNLSTYTPGPSELDRYRGLGEAASKRQAYQADFGKALGDEAQGWQAHNSQVDAINGLQNAARGGAPSAAAITGGQAGGQSLEGVLAGTAGAKGLGYAAAQSQTAGAQRAGLLAANHNAVVGRAGETLGANNVYTGAGGTMRAGDYVQQGLAQQRAEVQGQAELGQRQLNQGTQMGYEQMGINDQQQNVDAAARKAAMQAQANADQRAAHDARNARNMQIATSGMQAVGSFGVAASDVNAKQNVTMLSDDRTKLAAAWEEGHKSAVSDVQTLRTKSPEELKRYAAQGNRLAAVMRDTKADTYDDARGVAHPTEKRQPAAPAPRTAMSSVQRADRTAQNNNNAMSEENLAHAEALEPLGGIGTAAAGIMRQREQDYQRTRMHDPPTPLGERIQDGMADNMSRLYPEISTSTGQMEISDERAKSGKHQEGEMGRALEQGYKPFEYEYKPGFREQEGQEPGEKNVGPMAQNMAQNPITGNAVEKGEDGLLRISIPKTVKTNSAGIGYLARQMRQQGEEIARLKGGR